MPTPEQKELMKGKTCLILSHSKWNPNGLPGAGVANIIKICTFLRDNGVKVILATPDGPEDKVFKQYHENNLLDDWVFVEDMYGDNGNKNIAEAVRKSGKHVDHVFSHYEQLQPCVGEVAELLGIKHNPYSAYAAARDKYATRQALEKAGLATPKSMPISSAKDIPKAVEYLGFPIILKPTGGAGSLGVYKAYSEDEFRQAVERVSNDLQEQAMLSCNPGVELEAAMVAEQLMIPVMYEDFPTAEFDVDLLMWDGELVYGNVTDNWKPVPPYFLENGNNSPSIVPQEWQQELIDYSYKVCLALGFYKGAFHVESIYTKDGPMLIECNPRVGGGPVVEYNKRFKGVDLNEEFIISTLNVPIKPQPIEQTIANCVYYLNCPRTGLLEKADFFDGIKDCPNYVRHNYFVPDNVEVRGYDTQVPQWIGEFVIEGPVDQLVPLIRQMEDLMKKATDAVKVVEPKRERRPSRRASLIEPNIAPQEDH